MIRITPVTIIAIMLADFHLFAPIPVSENGIRKNTRPAPMISVPTAKETLLV